MDLDCGDKTTALKIVLNECKVEISVWRASHEPRRIFGKERFECIRYGVCKLVLLESIPNIEQQYAPCPEHSARFRKRFRLVGEKHCPELANYRVKLSFFEGQLHGVGLTPFNRAARTDRGSHFQHWKI